MIVSSECKISGNIQTSGSSRVVGSANITTNTGLSVNSALEDGTVTKGLYRDFSIWNSGGTSQYQNLNVGKNLYREQFDKEVSTSIGGTNYKARLFLHKLDSGQTFNGFTNTLFISSAKIKVQSGNYFNSTVITPGRVLMAVQKQYVTTQMDPNVYQQLRQLDVPAIKLADATNIDNPKKYIPGTSYSASPNLKFDDILYNESQTTFDKFITMYKSTRNPNQLLVDFLDEMEVKMPTSFEAFKMHVTEEGVAFDIHCATKADAAEIVQQFRSFKTIQIIGLSTVEEHEKNTTEAETMGYVIDENGETIPFYTMAETTEPVIETDENGSTIEPTTVEHYLELTITCVYKDAAVIFGDTVAETTTAAAPTAAAAQ